MSLAEQIEAVPEVDIETRDPATGAVHRTTIWAVVGEGEVYVRSLKGTAGRWYRELTAHPDTTLHVAGDPVAIQAVPVDDPESIEAATAGYRHKYAGSPYLATMIRDEILDTTTRLTRR